MSGDGVTWGVYVGGWIKRGPTGVIGTNKPGAQETVRCMLEDLAAGHSFNPESTASESVNHLLQRRCECVLSWEDWMELDRLEIAAGEAQGRPRVKFISTESMIKALGR